MKMVIFYFLKKVLKTFSLLLLLVPNKIASWNANRYII